MTVKQALIKELEQLVNLAVEQDYHYKRGRDFLYKGLAGVYLWWVKAKEVSGFLDEQYKLHNIVGRNVEKEEKFTRVLRLVWRMDWANESKAKLQQWSHALRKIDDEYTSNKAAYKTDAQNKLVLFIENAGGLRRLIGADKYDNNADANTESKSKRKQGRSEDDKARIDAKHLALGEQYFENSAKAIANIASSKPIAVNRKGYALALIRKKKNETYEVLSTISEDEQIKTAIVKSYARNNAVAPTVLRLLVEIIQTQAIPLTLDQHKKVLADTVVVTDETGKKLKRKQSKRVLFRKKQGDILLSENRTSCSVVTIAKPHVQALTSSKDVFLNVNDRRYIEEAIIQSEELSFYTTNDKNKVPVLRDSSVVASHKLVIENSVVDKKRAIYFYTLDSVGEATRPQANVAEGYDAQASWTARVDKQWLEKLHASFVSEWLNSVGAQITRPKNKTFGFEFSPKGLVIKHWGERGNYSKSTSLIEVDGIGRSSKQTNINVQSKDVLPVLNGLVGLDIEGKITLSVSDDVLSLVYQTELASYRVVIPTCNKHGRRNTSAFEAYEG
jgi:hypothetical protein